MLRAPQHLDGPPWVPVARRCPTVLLLSVALAGCTQEPVVEGPADAGGDGGDDGAVRELPRAEGPRMEHWDCPEGWRAERVGQGEAWAHSICLPRRRAECQPFDRQGLGEGPCQPVGTTCPAGGERLPDEEAVRALVPGFEGRLFHVDPGAAPGGDGSRQAPLRKLGLAVSLAPPGAVVVLGRGTHAGPVVLDHSLALVGACPAATLLSNENGRHPAVVVEAGAAAALANFTTVSQGDGIWVEATQPVLLKGLVVTVRGAGLVFAHRAGGGLVEDVVLRLDPPADSDRSVGLVVQAPADLVVRGVEIGGCSRAGVHAERSAGPDPMVLELSDLTVRGCNPGLNLLGGPRATLSRVLVEDHLTAGLFLEDTDSTDRPEVVVRDLVVRAGRSERDPPNSLGIYVEDDVSLSLEQVLLEGSVWAGLIAVNDDPGPGARLEATRLVVRDTRSTLYPPELGRMGLGLVLYGDLEVAVRRAAVLGNRHVGVHVVGLDDAHVPTLELTDVVVAGTRSTEDGVSGRAIDVANGVTATLSRVLAAGNRDMALLAAGWGRAPETRVEASDLSLLDTLPAACAEIPEGEAGSCRRGAQDSGNGYGLVVVSGARVRLEGFEVARAARVGVLLAGDSLLTARRGVVTDNGIGLNVMAPDSPGLGEDVFVFGNRVDVAAEEVSLPAPTSSIALR